MRSKFDQLFTWITPGYDGFETLLQAAVLGFNIPLAGYDLDFICETKPVTQTVVDELGLSAYLKRFKKARDPEDHIQIRRLDKTRRIASLWAYMGRDGDDDEFLVRSEGLYLREECTADDDGRTVCRRDDDRRARGNEGYGPGVEASKIRSGRAYDIR